MLRAPFLALLLLAACGGGAPAQSGTATATTATTGGEDDAAQPLLPTTTPVPVPQPAVAREQLSEPLRNVWEQVERTVSMLPPEGPTQATRESVQAWSEGPFRTWMTARHDALAEAVRVSNGVGEQPVYERAMAAALLGYALEDMAADVRGAPIPDDIANDEELLQVYSDNLDEALRPLALEAVQEYAFCATRLQPLGDESEWLPWRAYCVQRGREMIDVYQLYGDSSSTAQPDEPQGTEQAP